MTKLVGAHSLRRTLGKGDRPAESSPAKRGQPPFQTRNWSQSPFCEASRTRVNNPPQIDNLPHTKRRHYDRKVGGSPTMPSDRLPSAAAGARAIGRMALLASPPPS